MNIKFKVMSKTAIAAVIASAAIVPAMAVPAAAATVPVSDVVYSVNGQNTSLELPTFTSATNAGVLTNLDIKYVKSGTGEFFNFNDFTSALNAFDGDTEKAIDALTKSDKKVTVTDVVTGTVDAETGTVVPDTTADEFKVESIAAINDTSVTVTFPNDAGVKESDLTGKKITLKAGDSTLTATYAAGSLSNNSAVFTLDGEDVLVDATEYTVTSDWATITTAKFTAKIGNAFAKTFEAVTAKVTAKDTTTDSADLGERKIAFSAKNQYGEDFSLAGVNLSVEGSTLNGMPLAANEIKVENDVVTIAANSVVLKENDKLVIKITNKEGTKVVGEGALTYTVAKAETAVPTTIAELNATVAGQVAKSVVAGDTIVLTADVRDQNNTPMTGKNVRFVVTAGKELLATTGVLNSTTGTKDVANDTGVSFTVEKPGKVTVEAFNTANGAKATYTVEVGAKALTTLNVGKTTLTGNNNEVIKYGADKVTANPGAALTPEMIKFRVTDDKGVATTDVTATAKLRGGTVEATANDIVLETKTTKAGVYKITPYVGTSFDDAKAVKGGTITLTTKLNNIATSIDTVTLPALKVGTPVKQEIVVRNKHNEDITKEVLNDIVFKVYKDGALITSDVPVTVPNLPVLNETSKKYEATFTANAPGEYQVSAVVTNTSAITNINVSAEETTLASINLGAPIFDGIIAGDEDKFFRVITAKDNKSDTILPSIAGWTVDQKIGAAAFATSNNATVSYVKKDKDGKWEVITGGDDATNKATAEAVALVINPNHSSVNTFAEDKTITYKVSATVGDKTVSNTVDAKIKAKRAAKNVEVSTLTNKIVIGGTTDVMITPKDQYGKVVPYADATAINNQIKVTSSNGNVTVASGMTPVTKVTMGDLDKSLKGEAADELAGYKVTVTGNVKGSSNLKVDVKDASGEILTSATQVITVDTTAALVDKVEIKEKTGTQNAEKGVQLEAVVKDASNNEVKVNPTSLTWSITGLKDSKGNVLEGTFDADGTKGGTFTVTTGDYKNVSVTITPEGKIKNDAGELEGLTVEVSVKVLTENFKEGKTTVTIGDEVAELTSNLKVDKVYNKADVTTDNTATEVDFTGNGTTQEITDVENQIVFTFSGLDQYKEDILVTGQETANTVATSGDADLVAVWSNTDVTVHGEASTRSTLTVTANSGDGGQVYVKVGTETLTLDISVTGKAKENFDTVVAAKSAISGADFSGLGVTELTDAALEAAVLAKAKLAVTKGAVVTSVTKSGTNYEVTLLEGSATDTVLVKNATFNASVKDEGELTAALAVDGVKTITLTDNVTDVRTIDLKDNIVIDGKGKSLTLTGTSEIVNVLGLLVSGTATIKDTKIIVPTTMSDNVVEVMGNGANLTLENVEIENFKQAAIYVGGSETSGEKLTLKGNIKFSTTVASPWGGIGVRANTASVNATGATITYPEDKTVEIFDNPAAVGSETSTPVKPVIWTESADGKEVTGFNGSKVNIYKDDNGKRIKASAEKTATQTIFSN